MAGCFLVGVAKFRLTIIDTLSFSGIPATEALRKGLEDLRQVCQHIHTTFEVHMYICN